MIGKLFEIVGDTIIPKADCHIIQPLKRIIDEYPEDYLKIIAFLHYMKSMRPDDNPYADVPLSEREEKILYDLKLDVDISADAIKDAMDCVETIYYTTFYGTYRGFKTMLDKIGAKLLTVDIDFNAKEGNAVAIKGFMKDYEDIRKSFKIAFRDFEEEQSGGRARGGAQLADDEDEDY